MQQTISKNNLSFKTSFIPFCIIILLVFVPMIILWIYGGEFNESHNNWLVATNGRGWGLLPDGTYGFGKNSGTIKTSYEPYVISLSILVFCNIVYLLMAWFRLIKMSSFNFMNGSWLMMFSALISGLLYPANDTDLSWIIIVRCIIVIAGFLVGFFTSSMISTKVLVNTKLGEEYALRLLNEEYDSGNYVKDNIIPLKHDLKQNKKKSSVKVKDNKTKSKTKKK